MVGAVDVEDVAADLLVERPVVDPEDLGDLHAGEREAPAAQEELAGLAVDGHAAERHRRQPALLGELGHRGVEALAAQLRVQVVEARQLEFGQGGHPRRSLSGAVPSGRGLAAARGRAGRDRPLRALRRRARARRAGPGGARARAARARLLRARARAARRRRGAGALQGRAGRADRLPGLADRPRARLPARRRRARRRDPRRAHAALDPAHGGPAPASRATGAAPSAGSSSCCGRPTDPAGDAPRSPPTSGRTPASACRSRCGRWCRSGGR